MSRIKRANENQIILESLIGKSLEQAKELAGFNGFSIRITREDCLNYMVTMELRLDRINVQIDGGTVTSCSLG